MNQEVKKYHPGENEAFEMIMKTTPDCIKLFNLSNEVVYMNPGGLAEHNFKNLDEAIGFNWTDSVVPGQRNEVLQKIKESVTEKKLISIDIQHLHQYANREWCSMIINPVFDENGEIQYFVGISRDITDRKKSEQELYEMNKLMVNREIKMTELKEANKKCEEKIKKMKPTI